MQRKWWTKTRTILCSGLIITGLTASGALAVVACGDNNAVPPTTGYVNNRPVRGFYYQYEPKDYPRIEEVIRYIYNNNLVKQKYLEEGYAWPEITKITGPEITTRPYNSVIPEDVFKQDYEEALDQYQNYYRILRFYLEFEITDNTIQAPLHLKAVWAL